MKNIWRKIVALICVLTLCVGVNPTTTIAVDSYTGKLTIKGAESENSTVPTRFWIKGTDGYIVGKDWDDITMMPNPDDTNSGVFVDGVRINEYFSHQIESNVRFRKTSDANGWYFIENLPNVEINSVVTIKGTFYVDDAWLDNTVNYDSTPIVYETSSFQWNGSKWIDCHSSKLTIKGAESENSTVPTKFWIKGTDGYIVGKDWDDITMMPNPDDINSGVFVDGVRINEYFSHQIESNVRFRKTSDANGWYFIENLPNVNTDSIVTIKGTFYVDDAWLDNSVNYDSTPIVIGESQFQWDGTKWIDYVEPKAYNGKLSVEGAQIPTTKIGYIYLKGTDTYLSEKSVEDWDSSEAKLQAKTTDANSGIFVNGVKQPNGLLKKYLGTNNWYFAEGFTATSTGDVVSVKGTFYSQDGLAKVTFEESKFQWDGSAWVDYVEIISYQGILSYVDGANASNSTSVYLETTDNMSIDSWDHAFYGMDKNKGESAENGIWLDGEYQSGAHMKKVGGRYYVGGFGTANANSILKIAGTFICDTYNAKVTFEEAQFQWNGDAWVNYVEVKNYQGTLSILADITNNNQHLYLSTTDEHTAENTGIVIWESKFYAKDVNSGIYVNGKRKDDAFMKRTNTYAYYLEEIGTLNAGDRVTIEGTFFVEGNGNTVTFEEFNILWDGNCWLDCSEIKSYAEGTFWLDTNSPNTATKLFLRGSVDIHEDCSPSDNPDFGWNTTVSTTGFYKDGVACAGTLKNVANDGGWYLGLENAGIEVGNKLTIKGTFGYNGRYVKVAEYNLWYTNDGWKITAPITTDTKIYGDANGDNELNSLDLARLIRFFADEPVTVYQTGTDADGSNGINDKDRLKLYEYILEGARKTTDGSYSRADYPVYVDDVAIQLGAYQGPRAYGQNDYTYSNGQLTSTTVYTSFLNLVEFAKYKKAGFNILLHETDGPYNSKAAGIGHGIDDGNFRDYMQLAKGSGLDVYVTSMGLNSYIKYEGAGNGATSIDFNGDGKLSSTAITIDETKYGWDYNGNGTIGANEQMAEIFYYSDNIKHVSRESIANPGQKMTILEADIIELFEYIVNNGYQGIFKGLNMPDEPWLAGQTRYQSAVTLINKLAAHYGLDVEYHVNLFPTYASSSAVGNNYETYINGYGNAGGSLVYDFYPLLNTKKSWSSNFKNTLHTQWLTNLQTVATQGKDKYTTGITLQSSGFEHSGNTGFFASEEYRRDIQSDADMQFQVYSALAFGMKQINYFTYWEHQNQSSEGEWFTSSMVQYPANGGTESVTTDVYTYVKNANAEITKFDHVFMDYDWVNTKAVGSSDLFTNAMKNVTLSNVTVNSSTGSSIISHMYDSEKQLDGYWLVNMAEPSGSTAATLNVTFAGKNKAMVYIDGQQKFVDLTNGVYEADLAVGEGIFIIPLYIQ